MTYERQTYEQVEIAALREAIRRYADRFRIGTVEPMLVQQAIDRAFEDDGGPLPTFQNRVAPWLRSCFGVDIAADKVERNHRFLEEALELVQAGGCTGSEAHQLVDYVFGRPTGETAQEVGGVMVTLACFCLAHGVDMHEAGETELERIWAAIERIRAKHAAKPKHSPLAKVPSPLGTTEQEYARQMAAAIKAAMPRITGMWASFPYAELEGDDEVLTNLRASALAFRVYQRSKP